MVTLEDFYNYKPHQLDDIIKLKTNLKWENNKDKLYAAMYYSYPNVNDEVIYLLFKSDILQVIRSTNNIFDLRYYYMDKTDKVIYVLDTLSKIYEYLNDEFRSKSFNKAKTQFEVYNGPLNLKSLIKVDGIGKSTAEVIMEIIDKNISFRLEELKKSNPNIIEKINTIEIFKKIHGIGEKQAKDFYEKGYRTIEDLKINLNNTLGLVYYNELQKRIPRSEMDEWVSIFKQLFKCPPEIGPIYWDITGSYRRGEESSGDIDLIVRDINPKDVAIALGNIVIGEFSSGPKKFMGIVKLKNNIRQIDIRVFTKDEWYYGLLYNTGSKTFSILLRKRAQELNMRINEYCLTGPNGEKYPANSEQDIFDCLKIKYLKPSERISSLGKLIL